jgi:hypothetical protein
MLTKAQYNSLVAKNKKSERKEIIEAIIGTLAIFGSAYLWFAFVI